MMDLHPEVAKAAPGAVGALIALRWMRGANWLHTISSFVGGCALSDLHLLLHSIDMKMHCAEKR